VGGGVICAVSFPLACAKSVRYGRPVFAKRAIADEFGTFGTRNHRSDENQADHALTFKLEHSGGADQVGDIFGTPRRRSLKRVEPAISSRIRTIVQRVQRISAAIASGQNCLYPAWAMSLPLCYVLPSYPTRRIRLVQFMYRPLQFRDWRGIADVWQAVWHRLCHPDQPQNRSKTMSVF